MQDGNRTSSGNSWYEGVPQHVTGPVSWTAMLQRMQEVKEASCLDAAFVCQLAALLPALLTLPLRTLSRKAH